MWCGCHLLGEPITFALPIHHSPTQQDESRSPTASPVGKCTKRNPPSLQTRGGINPNRASYQLRDLRLPVFLAEESSKSLFETMAQNYANLALFLEIVMGLALLAGAMFARRKRFRLHACCQTVIVLLNFVVILLLMLPSFRVHVIPKIPTKLGKPYYAVATAHAALGSVAEAVALYIVLSAGTNLLPQRLRFTNYKLWMRSLLALWWLVLLLGLSTYARWYVPDLFR